MRNRVKALMSLLLVGAMLFTSTNAVKAAGIQGEIVVDSKGQKYEYVITNWSVAEEPADYAKLHEPKQSGEALTPGMEREVTFNTTYSVTTEISTEASMKLTSGLNIEVKLIKASLQREFNYKVSGKRTNFYSNSITKKEKVSFSADKAAQGYNTCVPYTGIIYNTNDVTVDIYKVNQYSHRHHWWSKKHSHTERGAFVKTITIKAKQPVIVTFLKYYKVSLKSGTVDGDIQNNDDVTILSRNY
jgi:hypothetical protein